MKKNKPINAQQIKFCHEYLIDHNAGLAVIRAGYKSVGSVSKGCRLLKDPKVKAYLDGLLAEQRKKYIATADKVMAELSLLAFSDISELMDFRNDITDLRYVEQNKKRAIASIHVSKTTSKNGNTHEHSFIKMHDKFAPLKLLALKMGLLDKKELNREGSVKQIVVFPASMEGEIANKYLAEMAAEDKEAEDRKNGLTPDETIGENEQ